MLHNLVFDRKEKNTRALCALGMTTAAVNRREDVQLVCFAHPTHYSPGATTGRGFVTTRNPTL